MLKYKCLVLGLFVVIGSSYAQLLNQRNWRPTEKDSLTQALQLMDAHQATQAYPILQNIYGHHASEEFLKYSVAKCAIHLPTKRDEAYKILNNIYLKNPNTIDIHFYLAHAAYKMYLFNDALTQLNSFLVKTKGITMLKTEAENLMQQINFARTYCMQSNYAKVNVLPHGFNTQGNQLFPVINLDASQLFFTDANIESSKLLAHELSTQIGRIHHAKKTAEIFKLTEVHKQFLKQENARAVFLSADEQQLFMVKDNCGQADLFVSILNGNQFSKPRKLKGAVNSLYNENACSLSPDGKTLFFSSNRSGGFGGFDLYRATLVNDSIWTNVVNLGPTINTILDEDTPFISADAQSFFFASKGLSSMGGFDIFKCNYLNDSTFTKAENLSYPINSVDDDMGFVISADGEQAYFCSDRRGGQGMLDLYSVEPHFKINVPSLCILKGKISLDNQPIAANLSIRIKNKDKLYAMANSNAVSGNYLFVLPTDNLFELSISVANQTTKSLEIDLSDMHGFIEKTKNIQFTFSSNDLSNNLNKTEANAYGKEESENTIFSLMDLKSIGNNYGMSERDNSETEILLKEKKSTFKSKNEKKKIVLNQKKSNTQTIQVNQNIEGTAVQLSSDSAELADRKEFMAWFSEGSIDSKKVEEAFIPKTIEQQSILDCNNKNGFVKTEGLVFRIQIAANKEIKKKQFPKLKHLGKIEQMDYHDDFMRYTIGGDFKTYGESFEFGKKVIEAGYNSIYIFGVMDGNRYKVEDLVEEGIFR